MRHVGDRRPVVVVVIGAHVGVVGVVGQDGVERDAVKKNSGRFPPEIVSHGVPTQDARNEKPLCGETSRSQASSSAT